MKMKGNLINLYIFIKHTVSASVEEDITFEEEKESEESDDELGDDSIFGYVKKMKQKERLKLVNFLN